jgi:N-acetylmuramoyl-L-alanine amidase
MYLAAMNLDERARGSWALAAAGVAVVWSACARAPAATPPPAPPGPTPALAPAAPEPNGLPAVKPVRGPLDLHVVYPSPGAVLRIRDSSFLFGTAGSGDARVTVGGQPARVWPNGAWLAYVALPSDSVIPLQIEARTERDSVSIVYPIRRAVPDAGRLTVGGVWLDTLSLTPVGRLWLARGEYLTLNARASEGAELRLRLADGAVVPLTPQPGVLEVPAGVRAFERDPRRLRTPVVRDRYVGLLRGRAVGPDPGPVLPLPFEVTASDSGWPMIEAIRGADTARARWPLQLAVLDSLPIVAELEDDTLSLQPPDSMTVGRAAPGGTYFWFFPSGTRVAVSGRRNDDLRLRLAGDVDAWIPVGEARPVGSGGPAPAAVVGSVSITSAPDRAVVRIPLSQRVPFRIDEDDRSLRVLLYGATGDVDWMRYGATDSIVRRMRWSQVAADQVALDFDLTRPVWGYRARWDRTDLVLDVRRPPRIDGRDALRGRLVALDPGHPPGGAIGPTGLREAEANLAVATQVQRLLEAAGARVLMTRTTDAPIDLWPRVQLAEHANADVLLSIHNNALPDGLNPFVNNGTSVYYNQPRSAPLARAIQAELVRRLGIRDLGFGRGDLALVRGTWMPSVLTEGLFMMLPDQEAALRSPEGQRQYAQAVVDGLRKYLEGWARLE